MFPGKRTAAGALHYENHRTTTIYLLTDRPTNRWNEFSRKKRKRGETKSEFIQRTTFVTISPSYYSRRLLAWLASVDVKFRGTGGTGKGEMEG